MKHTSPRLLCLMTIMCFCFAHHAKAQFMVNGYVPDYSTITAINAVDYDNLNIVYYAFVNTDENGDLLPVESWNVGKMEAAVTNAHNAGKLIYLVLGGAWGSEIIYEMASNSVSRANFVSNITSYLQTNNFDGLDIDWEGLSSAGERTAHENLMTDLRTAFDSEGSLGLTLTIGYGNNLCQWFSDVAVAAADYLQIMAYDAAGTWSTSPFANHSSYSVATTAVSYWVGRGIVKSKMILGLPCYGYKFASTAGGQGVARTYAAIVSTEPDLLSSDDDSEDGLTLFNNQDIIMQKVTYAMTQGLAGVFFWQMAQDTNDKRSLHKAAMYVVNSVTPPPLANFLVSKKTPNVLETITFTDHSSLGPASSYEWDFGLDAIPSTASGIGPHTVSYSSLGYKTVELVVTGSGGEDTKTKTSFINVSVPASTVDLSTVGIVLYPNPSHGVFNIESESIILESAEVYTMMSYKTMEVSEVFNNSITLDLTAQPQGMYMLVLKTQGGGTYTKRIVKRN